MNSDIFIAATGCIAEERRLEVIANNLANANAAGFKRDVPSFRTWLSQQAQGGGDPRLRAAGWAPAASSDSQGAFVYATTTDFSQGLMKETGNPFDFALQGEGFFVVATPNGLRYTRNGSFRMDQENYLVTNQGYKVMGDSGPIQIEGGGLQCDAAGRLKIGGRDAGMLRIVEFSDLSALKKAGGALFVAEDERIAPRSATRTSVHQGTLELSNVDVVSTMVGMIDALRAFESHQKAIRSLDEVSQKAVNELGRL